ncbi:MAG TPA: carboxypeptidase-like regulatory domain-containing protein, partial [Longimicrobiales bacterium]|nr:carboxypeptidase-like regulatory domain-containing protein [Longimicrobiales bacterium]
MRRAALVLPVLWAVAAGPAPARLAAQDADRLGAALSAACGVALDPGSEGVVAGMVTDSVSQVPLPGARVTLSLRAPGELELQEFETETDGEGFYAFCKVPAGVRATLVARLRRTSSSVALDVEAGMLHVEPLQVRLSDPAGTGILVGRIIDGERRA